MLLFYVEDLEASIVTLPEEESKHAVKVLRMKAGEELYLTDGQGTMCRCAILAPDAHACSVEVIERHEAYGQRRHRLHIAVAPTKNTERIDWLVEKAVEIGIDEITPIICDHSERNVLKAERLEKKVISAMKQSLKAYKPIINEPIKMVDFIAQQNATEDNTCRMICYCDGDIRVPLHQTYDGTTDALVLIGPEGDFSQREVEQALSSGFHPVTLGNCRLRTETAALYATVAANFLMDQH